MLSKVIVFLLLAWFGAAALSDYQVHEESLLPSHKWRKLGRIDSHAVLPVRIGLTQSNIENAYDYLMDVSDPTSPNYGKHWASNEVIEKFAPSEETRKAVLNWLQSSGIKPDRVIHHDNKGWMSFIARASELESLVQSQYHEYEHESGERISLGCDRYYLPAHIKPHIDYITPGVRLATPLKKRKVKSPKRDSDSAILFQPSSEEEPASNQESATSHVSLKNCDRATTPACIRALYKVPLPAGKPHPNNSFGIYETGDYYAQGDLNRFFRHHAQRIPRGTHPILKSVDGGKAPVPLGQSGIESAIDFQLSYPIVYPQNITLYQVDDRYYASLNSGQSQVGQFNTWLDAMDGSYCNFTAFGETGDDPIDPKYPDHRKGGYKGKRQCGVYKPTKVITVSYGVQEDDLPAYYQKRQCLEFAKLGMMGTTILVASGDTGVAGVPGDHGHRNGCQGPNAKRFNPTEPNSCYAVTNVGGTQIARGNTVNDPEVAVSEPGLGSPFYFSSGGFSNIFPRPKYQDAAIKAYFKNHKPPYRSYTKFGYKGLNKVKGRYNRLGRGIPDLSAIGRNFVVYYRGKQTQSEGTSGSSPIVAAIISRIVDERLKAGKGPLGFINPVLYTHPEILNDITNGTNPGCGTEGFRAVKGWDPVTGLGTPNYPRMLKLFLSLP